MIPLNIELPDHIFPTADVLTAWLLGFCFNEFNVSSYLYLHPEIDPMLLLYVFPSPSDLISTLRVLFSSMWDQLVIYL